MEWKVAPTYQSWDIGTIDEEKGKAYVSQKCWKCGGSGQYAWFGTCYTCNGRGRIGKWVKIYSPEEYDKYVASQERAKERKEEEKAQRIQNLFDQSDANKAALLEKFGYNTENPQVFIVVGDNTYAIKDDLKAAGARFEKSLGWYFTHEVEVPDGYNLAPARFDDIFEWNPLTKKISIKEDIKDVVSAAIAPYLPKSNSEWVGDIKERLRDLKVTLTSIHTVDGYYGTSVIYTFKQNENVLVWMTTSYQELEVGDTITLTGTVKDHDEYKGVKQTKLSRCIVKKG